MEEARVETSAHRGVQLAKPYHSRGPTASGITGDGLETGERVEQHAPDDMSPGAAHAAGIIEGAGIALGLTALELLDQLDAL